MIILHYFYLFFLFLILYLQFDLFVILIQGNSTNNLLTSITLLMKVCYFIFLLLITIKSFFALVIPVYNKFLVSSIGADCGIHIITTSNSLPLRFMYCYTIAMF